MMPTMRMIEAIRKGNEYAKEARIMMSKQYNDLTFEDLDAFEQGFRAGFRSALLFAKQYNLIPPDELR